MEDEIFLGDRHLRHPFGHLTLMVREQFGILSVAAQAVSRFESWDVRFIRVMENKILSLVKDLEAVDYVILNVIMLRTYQPHTV